MQKALSLKYNNEVIHYLIESSSYNTVKIKDAQLTFHTLYELISHHTKHEDGSFCFDMTLF